MLSKAVLSLSRSRTCLYFTALKISSRNLPTCNRILGSANSFNLLKGRPQWPAICGRFYAIETGEERELIVSKSVEKAFKARDKIPDDYTIIYRAPIEKYIKYTYLTTAAAITLVPIASVFVFTTSDGTYPVDLAGIPLFDTPNDVYLTFLLLIMTILNVAHTIAKYPFRIYRQPQEHKYIAVFQHLIPLMVRRKEFKAGEFRRSNGIIWKDALYLMKNKNVIIIADHFTSNYELERMMIEPKKDTITEAKKRRSRMI